MPWKDPPREKITHLWENEPGFLLHHLTTGLRFFCSRIPATPAKAESWDVQFLVTGADTSELAMQSAVAGMEPNDYIRFLGQAAVELAGEADDKNRGKRPKF